jgi:hypothetical protein
MFDVANTVVVCRPDEVREAAIVTSCLPADQFTPIIAIESPPIPQGEYIELYTQFRRRAQDAPPGPVREWGVSPWEVLFSRSA